MQHNEELNLLNVPVFKTSFQTALRARDVDVINHHLCDVKNKQTCLSPKRHPTSYRRSYGCPTAVILGQLTITSVHIGMADVSNPHS